MITAERARNFAVEWIEAWNSHDLPRILSHYTEDFEMSSPFVAKFTGEDAGVLRGKAAVGAYWRAALERIPDLRFELLNVFAGVDSVAIYYKAVLGKRATEVLFLDESGKAYRAFAHYDEP